MENNSKKVKLLFNIVCHLQIPRDSAYPYQVATVAHEKYKFGRRLYQVRVSAVNIYVESEILEWLM